MNTLDNDSDTFGKSISDYYNLLSNKQIEEYKNENQVENDQRNNQRLTNVTIKSIPFNINEYKPYKTYYLSLDTRYAQKDLTNYTYKWDIFDQPTKYGVYLPSDVNIIKSVKIQDYLTNVPNTNYVSDWQKIGILIHEFSSQSFRNQNPISGAMRHFHFYGKIQSSYDDNFLYYVGFKGGINKGIGVFEQYNRYSDGNDGYYEFKNMKRPQSITISSNDILNKIPIYQDTFPLIFNNVATAIFPSGHNIPSNYTGWFRVYINGFSSSNSLDNQLVDLINSQTGIFAQYASSTTITLYDNDFNILNSLVGSAGTSGTIYLSYFRTLYELEFKYKT